MNLLRCRLVTLSDGAAIKGDGVELPIDAGRMVTLRKALGEGEFLLGFRPEDILVEDTISAGALCGIVDVVEGLGHESLVNVRTGESNFIVRMPPENAADVTIGEQLSFTFKPDRLRFFSNEDGKAIRITS